jgi:hypothetical protein
MYEFSAESLACCLTRGVDTTELFIGIVQQDCFLSTFSSMDSSQAVYLVFKDISNLIGYLKFLIDSRLLFIAESRYSLYCLLQRVATLRIALAWSHYY